MQLVFRKSSSSYGSMVLIFRLSLRLRMQRVLKILMKLSKLLMELWLPEVIWVKEHNPDITLIKDYHIYRPLPQDALYEVTNLDVFVQNKGYK